MLSSSQIKVILTMPGPVKQQHNLQLVAKTKRVRQTELRIRRRRNISEERNVHDVVRSDMVQCSLCPCFSSSRNVNTLHGTVFLLP